MDLGTCVPLRTDERFRLAERLYLAGLLILAWFVAPYVSSGIKDFQVVLQLCGTGPAPPQDAAAPCPPSEVVMGVLQIVLGVLPLAVFAVAARRPRRAGEPWMVLAGLLACWLSIYPLQILWFVVLLAVHGTP